MLDCSQKKPKSLILTIIYSLLLLSGSHAFAQSYGLYFTNSETGKYYKTVDNEWLPLNQVFIINFDISTGNDIEHGYTASIPVEEKSVVKRKVWIWLCFIILFDILILVVYTIRKKIKKKLITSEIFEEADNPKHNPITEIGESSRVPIRNTMHLFGSFQFYQSDGKEISSKFSPLLKELFLIIIFHSSNNGNGISTNSLIEIFWPGMPDKSARNNLAVNIGKIRGILGPEHHELLFNQSGYWKFMYDKSENQLYCDYLQCTSLLNSKSEFSQNEIITIINSIQRGSLLSDLSYEWLDGFKAKFSNSIIDTFLNFTTSQKDQISADLIIKIADSIILFDMVNENAMELKCKALVSLGKHSLAKDIYIKFEKEYKTLYDIEFNRSFKSIIN